MDGTSRSKRPDPALSWLSERDTDLRRLCNIEVGAADLAMALQKSLTAVARSVTKYAEMVPLEVALSSFQARLEASAAGEELCSSSVVSTCDECDNARGADRQACLAWQPTWQPTWPTRHGIRENHEHQHHHELNRVSQSGDGSISPKPAGPNKKTELRQQEPRVENRGEEGRESEIGDGGIVRGGVRCTGVDRDMDMDWRSDSGVIEKRKKGEGRRVIVREISKRGEICGAVDKAGACVTEAALRPRGGVACSNKRATSRSRSRRRVAGRGLVPTDILSPDKRLCRSRRLKIA